MPALAIQPQFVPKILSGEKPFTLRHPRADGRDPRAGQTIYFNTGMRTKKVQRVAELYCTCMLDVYLLYGWIAIEDWDPLMLPGQLENFARLDGFEDYAAFCQFHGLKDGSSKILMKLISWFPRPELRRLIEANNPRQ